MHRVYDIISVCVEEGDVDSGDDFEPELLVTVLDDELTLGVGVSVSRGSWLFSGMTVARGDRNIKRKTYGGDDLPPLANIFL